MIEQLVVDVPDSLARGGKVSEAGYNRMIMVLGAVEPELSEIPYGDVVTRAYLSVP